MLISTLEADMSINEFDISINIVAISILDSMLIITENMIYNLQLSVGTILTYITIIDS